MTIQTWSYSLDRESPFTEYGEWQGADVPILRPHFHTEGQLATVISGRRAFRVGAGVHLIEAGQFLYIPPMVPHQGIALPREASRCINAYVLGDCFGTSPFVSTWTAGSDGNVQTSSVLRRLAELERPFSAAGGIAILAAEQFFRHAVGSVADLAGQAGLSREHYTRRFSREMGMSPHRYRLMCRLNEGRRRLREGDPAAAIAADLMFSDQSHFGRLFRQAFGTTPHQYRIGIG